MSLQPSTIDIITAACDILQAEDVKAQVVPRWLPVKEGDSADDFRSDQDVVDGERIVHTWMVDLTSPSTNKIEEDYFENLDESELAGQTIDSDSEVTLKLGLVKAYRQGTDADNSQVECVNLKDTAEAAFMKKPKLGLAGVKGHKQLQLISVSWWQSAEALCHIYLFALKVKVTRTITFE
jgi:hypothetical protein